MWLSTLTYWITTLMAAANAYIVLHELISQTLDRVIYMRTCLTSLSESDTALSQCKIRLLTQVPHDNSGVFDVEDCAGTAALTVNVGVCFPAGRNINTNQVYVLVQVVLGDSIVWWRAWVLWPNNKVVRCVCISMILISTGTYLVHDEAHSLLTQIQHHSHWSHGCTRCVHAFRNSHSQCSGRAVVHERDHVQRRQVGYHCWNQFADDEHGCDGSHQLLSLVRFSVFLFPC